MGVGALMPALALATPALAFPPAGLSDSQQPGAASSSPNSSICPRLISMA
jgi:hypothetical protein